MAVKAVYVELLEEQMCPCQKRKLEQALDNAKAEIATLNTQIETLNATVVEKDNRIAELENQVANPVQPNENAGGASANTENATGSTENSTASTSTENEAEQPEPEFNLSLHIEGQYPSELRVGVPFLKTVKLTGSDGVEGAYYPFELKLTDGEDIRYTLDGVLGNAKNITFENGTIKGEVSQGLSQFTLVGVPINSGFDRALYPANAWFDFSYHQTQAGKRYSDHNVEIPDTYDIQPETGDLGERHPVVD